MPEHSQKTMWAARRAIEMSLALAIGLACGAAAVQAQGAAKTTAKSNPAQANASAAPVAPTGSVQGLSQSGSKQPIHIDAANLEVRDKDKIATFSGDAKGDVKVTQGDTIMRAKSLVVYYDGDAASAAKGGPAPPAAGGNQRIRKIEAKGNVIVSQKEQTITGASAVFDMRSNTVTLSGGVLLTTAKNVTRSESVTMDMTTGVVRLAPSPGGRINTIIVPGDGPPQANPMQPR